MQPARQPTRLLLNGAVLPRADSTVQHLQGRGTQHTLPQDSLCDSLICAFKIKGALLI